MKLPINIDYSGKVVVITGAGGLICGAMARAFAMSGARVAALDINEDAVKKLADELAAEGFICKGYKANVLSADELETVRQSVISDLGECDILVNGAGGNNPRATTDNEYQHEVKDGGKSFFDLDTAGVDFVFKLNFQGTLIPTQVFAKDMAEKKNGIKISCDLNYRGKLWTREEANKAMAKLCKYVDVCISNEEDAKDVFGIEAENTDIYGGKLNHDGYKSVAK